MRRSGPVLACLALAVAAGLADDAFVDDFDDNRNHWRLDEQWLMLDGELRADGLAEQVLAVGCDAPAVSDFRARLKVRQVGQARAANYGFGLLYRFDAAQRNGCFVAVGADHGYGFGRVDRGTFSLVMQGRSGLVKFDEPAELTLEVVGDRHVLRLDGQLLDVWRDPPRTGRGFGLLVIDAVDVAFDGLRLEPLGGGGAPKFGPPSPTAASARSLGTADLETASAWRQHFNRAAHARGAATLPVELDAVDLAVLALLKRANLTGEVAGASVLVDWLQRPEMVAAGAVGAAPAAALTFWLQFGASDQRGEFLGGSEDLLAALSWYYAVRAETAAGWIGEATAPLAVDEPTAARVEDDRRRWLAPLTEADRAARQAELDGLLADVLHLARRPAPTA